MTLFRGLSVKMFRIAVGTGICLVAFEEILRCVCLFMCNVLAATEVDPPPSRPLLTGFFTCVFFFGFVHSTWVVMSVAA